MAHALSRSGGLLAGNDNQKNIRLHGNRTLQHWILTGI
jgi:hypothetical protein